MPELHKKDKDYKEYRKLDEQRAKLWRQRNKLPLIELDEPYQRGWVIYYDLRADIKKREDATTIMKALELGSKPSMTRSISHIKNVRTGAQVKEPIYPGMKELKKKDIPEYLSKWFIKSYARRAIWDKQEYYELCIPRYWLVRRVKPNMITHTKDTSLDNQIKELNLLMDAEKFRKFYGRHRWCADAYNAPKQRTFVKEINAKFKRGEIEEIFNEKFPKVDSW